MSLSRIICAPDSFKGTLEAPQVAASLCRGIKSLGRCDLVVESCPVADGGEGTAAVLAGATGAEWVTVDDVPGPCGDPVSARYAVDHAGRRAFIDLAAASGWHFLNDSSPSILRRSTIGTGVLIRHAMTQSVEEVILGLGGSATCDGGVGLLQGLGATLRDQDGRVMDDVVIPEEFGRLASIDPPPLTIPIRVAADVTNPLLGPNGAASVYGPQKGASPDEVRALEQALAHLAALSECDEQEAGCGAAGGTAFGLRAWTGSVLESGIDLVGDMIGFNERLAEASLVVTGEGRFDGQSRSGKAVSGVLRRARAAGVDVALICGSIVGEVEEEGVIASVDLSRDYGIEVSMKQTEEVLERAASALVSRILAGSA